MERKSGKLKQKILENMLRKFFVNILSVVECNKSYSFFIDTYSYSVVTAFNSIKIPVSFHLFNFFDIFQRISIANIFDYSENMTSKNFILNLIVGFSKDFSISTIILHQP